MTNQLRTHPFRYGHAVLRKPDPRFLTLQDFVTKSDDAEAFKSSKIINLVLAMARVAPEVSFDARHIASLKLI